MDLHAISRVLNASTADGIVNPMQLPSVLLETFLPGYGMISRVVSQLLGFDMTYVVSLGLLLIAMTKAWGYLARTLPPLVLDYVTSSIYLGYWDDLFDDSMDWIAENRAGRRAKNLVAQTKYGEDVQAEFMHAQDPGAGDLFHFAKWAAKVAPKYIPNYGSNLFIHNRWLFIFERVENKDDKIGYWAREYQQYIRIRTFGWSATPIKVSLQEIKMWACERHQDKTIIRMPDGHGGSSWKTVSARPSRRLDTVVLDAVQKEELIQDVNDYLSPTSEEWYASRGIPLRRGYLFYGPPGTGKSSLSFSIAGIFGLSIYVVSMVGGLVTEDSLHSLFNGLPKRCVVLLEDIDEAGLVKRDIEDGSVKATEAEETKSKDKKDDEDKKKNKIKPITLSGLLNVIDGVSSHEGRILIMTSNCPEKLDAALLRPGRIDMHIKFTLATKDQLREIFLRMYAPRKPTKNGNNGSDTPPTPSTPVTHSTYSTPSTPSSAISAITFAEDELLPLAYKFADALPDQVFSPAEVQNFLIARKKSPMRAVNEVQTWRDTQLTIKAEKAREKDAQAKEAHEAPEKGADTNLCADKTVETKADHESKISPTIEADATAGTVST